MITSAIMRVTPSYGIDYWPVEVGADPSAVD